MDGYWCRTKSEERLVLLNGNFGRELANVARFWKLLSDHIDEYWCGSEREGSVEEH